MQGGEVPHPKALSPDSPSPVTACLLCSAAHCAPGQLWWHRVSPASAPAALNDTGRNLTWVFLTWSLQMPGNKAKKRSRAGSCEAELTPGNHHCHFQGPLSREADFQPSWELCHRSKSTEIQVKRFGFCQKPIGLWFLPRGCCAGFCLTFAGFVLSFRKMWGSREPRLSCTVLMHWTQVSIGTSQTKAGRRNLAGEISSEAVLLCFFSLNHSLWQIIRDHLSLQLPILYLTYAVRIWSPGLEVRHSCLALISLKQF